MTENEIASHVVDCAIKIHKRIGPGVYESVYERILAYELRKRGIIAECQVAVPLIYEELRFEEAFRADIIIDRKVLIELKSVENLAPVHKKQVLTYLKLTDIRLGLLINFGSELLKDGIHRIVNGLAD